MLDPKFFDNLAKQLSLLIPANVSHLRKDLEQNFRDTLQSIFTKLDLVTREEFDAQVKLLEKAEHRVKQLEEKIAEFEKISRNATK